MVADIDHLSAGRLVLGLGIGDRVEEFAQMDLPFAGVRSRQEALEETIQILNGLWGAAPFSFRGQHLRVESAHVEVAEYADMANFGPHQWVGNAVSIADIQRKFDALRGHCDALGRAYNRILRSHYAFVLVAKTPTEVQAKLDAIPRATLDFLGTLLIAGTPDEVIRHYQSLVDAGMQYFVTMLQGDAHETLELLGTRVLPSVG
jgi:alkanesulfonate monooxygenase SsuD/methylene tetrahydromethanopterin reductase-like flavin-dependent oxidoreductase (luciferase family)